MLEEGIDDIYLDKLDRVTRITHAWLAGGMIAVFWESAQSPPENTFLQRRDPTLVDRETNQLGIQIAGNSLRPITVEAGRLMRATGSFIVKRAAPMALEIFTEIDRGVY
jgi:hypothetical protein